jgi:hypothetical protein
MAVLHGSTYPNKLAGTEIVPSTLARAPPEVAKLLAENPN